MTDPIVSTNDAAEPKAQPAYLNHPGLKTYAQAWRETEATDVKDPDYDNIVDARADRAHALAGDVIDAPARSLDDVIAKLAAYMANRGGGKTAPDDPALFANAVGPMLEGADDLGRIALDLIALASPPPAASEATFADLEARLTAIIPAFEPASDGPHHKELQAIIDASRSLRATGPIGRHFKAWLADFWITHQFGPDAEDYELEVKLAADALRDTIAASDPSSADLGQWFKTTWAWETALATYEAAEAHFNDLLAQCNAADEASAEETPPPPELLIFGRGVDPGAHYHSEDHITDDKDLSFDEKVAKLAAFRAWHPTRMAAREAHRCDALDDEWQASGGALEAARDALLALRAPHVRGLLEKLALYLENQLDVDLDLTDPTDMSEALSDEDRQVSKLASIYQDALAQVEPGHPAVAAKVFDANAWIEEFEKFPGHVVDDIGISFVEPHAFPDGIGGETPPPGRALVDALTDWQLKAVRRAGRHRDGVRRIVKDIVMTYANSWDTREQVEGYMVRRHPKATHQQQQEAWDQVDAMDDVVFGLSKEEAQAHAGTRWLVAWRVGGGSVWIDRETDELVIGCSPDSLGSDMRFMRDEITRLPELKAAVREALASEA